MTEVYLRRRDPARNVARFYRMHVVPTLFGEWSLVREWGRIGSGGQVKASTFGRLDHAEGALARLAGVKLRKGYKLNRGTCAET
ncbi:WGR domain-containing protein [Sphaerothrix gracilis]|uniref:WGR domain-containing protein n=1 Tax=Sphaerothrix gracilis TaxID=3151835 RepID=UPI0031FCE675